MAPVRFGLVGTGHWARTAHGPALAAHPDVDLVGVWGRDHGRAVEAAAPLGAVAYDDYDELLAAVDAVAFAVPPRLQGDLALRAAEAGKHLLLEKPIALDTAGADALVEAAERNDLATVVCFTHRFVPAWETWLTEVAQEARPEGGRADGYSRLEESGPYFDSAWRHQHGALWDLGPHLLSLLIPVFGPVARVTGARGAGDLVHLVLTHEDGRTSRMSTCFTMPAGTERITVEVYAEGGWLLRPDAAIDVDDAYFRMVDELVLNVRAGETRHRCDIRFGREVVDVLSRCEAVLGTPSG